MKKIIQILLVLILLSILSLIIIFIFNPLESLDKIIGNIINNYLENNIKGYTTQDTTLKNEITTDKHPLLNESQEKMLDNFGVDVSQLPAEITPGMESCFMEKLGQERAEEIASGAIPSALEFFKAKDCIEE